MMLVSMIYGWRKLAMAQSVFQKMKGKLSFGSRSARTEAASRDYTPSEIASLRQQLKASNARARASVLKIGVTKNPRLIKAD